MPVNLPTVDIDPDAITTLEEAKTAIGKLLNVIERMVGMIHQLSAQNQQLKQEIARLKCQPPIPLIASSRQATGI